VESEALFRRALQGADAVHGMHPRIPARFRYHLGRLLLKTGRLGLAEAELVAAHSMLEKSRDVNEMWAQEAAAAMVELYEALGEPKRAARYRAAGSPAAG
jgi:hypothetical protein